MNIKKTKVEQEHTHDISLQLEAIINAFPDVYMILDQSGMVLEYKSGKAGGMYIPSEEYVNKKIQDMMIPGVSEIIKSSLDQAIETNSIVEVKYSYSMSAEERFYDGRVVLMPDGRIMFMVRDITDQRWAEIKADRVSEELKRYSRVQEGAELGLSAYNKTLPGIQKLERRWKAAESLMEILATLNSNDPFQKVLSFIVDQALYLMGAGTGALYRLHGERGLLEIEISRGIPDEYRKYMKIPVGMGAVGYAVKTRKPVIVSDISKMTPRDILEDPARGEYIGWLISNFKSLLAVPPICKDEIYGGMIFYYHDNRNFSKDEVDLAATFAYQAALAIDNARLREHIKDAAVAEERSRLARDLHDAVTQTLFSISLIAEVLPRLWDKNPELGRRRLEELRQLTRGAMAEMRSLLLELRPATLIETSLEDLLRQLAEAVTGRARIPVALYVEGKAELPADVKIAFYRIVQEALNNIVKHSGASHASVSLKSIQPISGEPGSAVLMIKDDGCGFDPGSITGEHLGIGIMRERADSVNVRIDVKA